MHEMKVMFQTLVRYNRTMNEQLYLACSTLSDEERRRDRGAWFKSIHGTLNHILLADKVWMGRFSGHPFVVASLSTELFATWDELKAERFEFDDEMIAWVDELDPQRLRETLRFTPMSRPVEVEWPLWLCVAHLWNHATHHRGQATALMEPVGADSGVTDLPALRSVQEFVQAHPL